MKRRSQPPAPPKAILWWAPGILLLAIPAVMAALSAREDWFTNAAARLFLSLFPALSLACLALAAAMAFSGGLRAAVDAHLGRPAQAGPRPHQLWLAQAYLGMAALQIFLKYCQYRGCQLPSDSTVSANLGYNLMRTGTLESSVMGVSSYFSVHFMPLIALFAPLALVPPGAFSMLVMQAAVVASVPLAAYAIIYRRSHSQTLSVAGLLLSLTCPFYLTVARASLAVQVCLPAFLLWAAYHAEGRRWWAAAAFLALAACCVEQVPLTFFGTGLYLTARGWRNEQGRGRILGPVVCVASLILLRSEMKLIHSYPDNFNAGFYTPMWDHLGSTPAEIVRNVLTHPFETLAKVSWPLWKLSPLWNSLWTTGFFCLAAPLEMIPWAVTYFPHFMANPGHFYHNLATHYPAYVLGPLLWAMCAGLCAAHDALTRRGFGAWSLVYALFFGGLNLACAPRMLDVDFLPHFFWSAPVLAPKIPQQASVWAVEFAGPWLACRRYIRLISGSATVETERRLFRPDFVLIDPSFLMNDAHAAERDRLLTFLWREGYVGYWRTETMLLLKHPSADGSTFGPPPAASLPQQAEAGGRDFGQSLRALITGRQL